MRQIPANNTPPFMVFLGVMPSENGIAHGCAFARNHQEKPCPCMDLVVQKRHKAFMGLIQCQPVQINLTVNGQFSFGKTFLQIAVNLPRRGCR